MAGIRVVRYESILRNAMPRVYEKSLHRVIVSLCTLAVIVGAQEKVTGDSGISVDKAIGISLQLTPPSHFSNLNECRSFIENDPVMKPLCSCGCCRDKNDMMDGCYCPKCDTRKSSMAELMVSPNFRTPEKQFEPLLCPMQLGPGSLDSGCSFREWDIERMIDTPDKDKPPTRLGRVLAPM